MAEWEAEIKIRRNGRLVKWEKAFGPSPSDALYAVHNDLELWAQDHSPEEENSGKRTPPDRIGDPEC